MFPASGAREKQGQLQPLLSFSPRLFEYLVSLTSVLRPMLEDSQQRCGINTRRLTHDQQRGSGMLVIYVTTGVSSDTLSTRVSR